MLKTFLNKNFMVKGAFILSLILTIWWLALKPFSTDLGIQHSKYIWGSFYQLIALWGAICGILVAKSYGGFKSVLGKSISFFSYGLLLQCVGQTVYSYYNLFANIQAPYPSFGDIGYLGSVLFYIFGVLYLAKVSGVKVSLKSMTNKFSALVIPILILGASYFIFLQDYDFNLSSPLKVFLDFGYPLGQAFYVSIAILTLILSRKILGGIMRKPVLFFLISLIVQYASDFNFLFQANKDNWYVGGVGDFLYMISYLLMTISIIQIGYSLKSVRES